MQHADEAVSAPLASGLSPVRGLVRQAHEGMGRLAWTSVSARWLSLPRYVANIGVLQISASTVELVSLKQRLVPCSRARAGAGGTRGRARWRASRWQLITSL